MIKDSTLILRISEADKKTIEAAAEAGGQSLTTFVTDAALKRARAVALRPVPRGMMPYYFRAICQEAAQGGAKGSGYVRVGRSLASSLGSEQPSDLDEDEWAEKVADLVDLINAGYEDQPWVEDQVWDWFKRYFPKKMARVPARRRGQFLAGVYLANDEGLLDDLEAGDTDEEAEAK